MLVDEVLSSLSSQISEPEKRRVMSKPNQRRIIRKETNGNSKRMMKKENNTPILSYSNQNHSDWESNNWWHSGCSIPFNWEEKPGKPRPLLSRSSELGLHSPPNSNKFNPSDDNYSKAFVSASSKHSPNGRLSPATPPIRLSARTIFSSSKDLLFKDKETSDAESDSADEKESDIVDDELFKLCSNKFNFPTINNLDETTKRSMLTRSCEFGFKKNNYAASKYKSTELGLHDMYPKSYVSPEIIKRASHISRSPSTGYSNPAMLANCLVPAENMSNAVPVEDHTPTSIFVTDKTKDVPEDKNTFWISQVQMGLSGQLERTPNKSPSRLPRSRSNSPLKRASSAIRKSLEVDALAWKPVKAQLKSSGAQRAHVPRYSSPCHSSLLPKSEAELLPVGLPQSDSCRDLFLSALHNGKACTDDNSPTHEFMHGPLHSAKAKWGPTACSVKANRDVYDLSHCTTTEKKKKRSILSIFCFS